MVNFVDTVGGMRVRAVVQGLEAGVYELRADDAFYDPEEAGCDRATAKGKARPPVIWRLGPLRAGYDGVARFDRVYAGIANTEMEYVVPAQAVRTANVPRLTIDQRGFFLSGRKLTLHKRKPASLGGVGDVVACATIHGSRPFGEVDIESVEGSKVSGEIVFQQGEDNRATMSVRLKNLVPGPYRLVVHEFAGCHGVNGLGVGEPYHPEDDPVVTLPNYGWPLKRGDLGTFTADASGTILGEKIFEHPLTSGSPHTIRGRAVVVETVVPGSATGKPTRVGCGMVAGF